MHQIKKISFLFLLISILFVTSGCVSVKSTKDTSNVDGGIFKTFNKGDTWQQKVLIPTTSGKPGSFAGMSVSSMIIDPSDEKAVYFGSEANGLLYSYNGGQDWQTITRIKGGVQKMIINPNDSRKMYVVTSTQVFKTIDGGENWEEFNSLQDKMKELKLSNDIKDFVVTKSEEEKIFVATFYGLIKSSDGGNNWEKIELIPPEKKATINAIAINEKNPNEIYYVTNTTFFRSQDGGQNWATKKLPTTKAGWALLIDPTDPNIIYMGVKGFEKK